MGPILDQQVCYSLYSTSSVVTQAYRSLLSPHKLTYPQFVVMMSLWQNDNVSITELASSVGITKATMTPLLKRLEALNYITKELEPGNDRQKRISLTSSGHALALSAEKIAQQALCATGLNDDEAKQLLSLCSKIKISINRHSQ
jgi:DNA-binding MarR family transcriptional regulator